MRIHKSFEAEFPCGKISSIKCSFNESDLNPIFNPDLPQNDHIGIFSSSINISVTDPPQEWLNEVVNVIDQQWDLNSDKPYNKANHFKKYLGTGKLVVYEQVGMLLKDSNGMIWELKDMWFQDINFGELDHSNSEYVTIEFTLKFSEIIKKEIFKS